MPRRSKYSYRAIDRRNCSPNGSIRFCAPCQSSNSTSESVVITSDEENCCGEDDIGLDEGIFSPSELEQLVDNKTVWDEILCWNNKFISEGPNLFPHSRTFYSGDSARSARRRKKNRRELLNSSAKYCRTMTSYYSALPSNFSPASSDIDENVVELVSSSSSEEDKDDDSKMIAAIQELTETRAKISRDQSTERSRLQGGSFEYLQYLCIVKYLQLRLENIGKMAASEQVAKMYFQTGFNYKGRSIRKWSEFYLHHGSVPDFRQGNHCKTYSSIIQDENICNKMRQHLRTI